jgi:hypothetical protein
LWLGRICSVSPIQSPRFTLHSGDSSESAPNHFSAILCINESRRFFSGQFSEINVGFFFAFQNQIAGQNPRYKFQICCWIALAQKFNGLGTMNGEISR